MGNNVIDSTKPDDTTYYQRCGEFELGRTNHTPGWDETTRTFVPWRQGFRQGLVRPKSNTLRRMRTFLLLQLQE